MICSVDIETYKYNQQKGVYEPVLDAREFVIGCLKTETGITEFFYKAGDMANYISKLIDKNKKQKRLTYIYGHNVEYDFYGIMKGKLMSNDFKYILFNPFLTIQKEKGYWVDTMSFNRTSLDRIGKMMGFKKLEMPMEIKEIDELKDYVERDTEIVLKLILDKKRAYNEALNFKPRKLMTAGQVAMSCFRTFCRRNFTEKYFSEFNFKTKRKEIVKTKFPKLIREAYRGGDNQALQIGKFKDVTLLDINGLYGYIMTIMKFPDLRSENLQKNPTINMFLKYLKSNIGIARVIINAPSTENPVLPVRFGDYQVFPSNKKLRGTWTFIEIEQALKEGYKLEKVEWCIRWNELIVNKKPLNPLKKFIETIYELEKKATNDVEKDSIKSLRNHLSGKFGQNRKNKDYKIVDRNNVMEYINNGYKSISKYLNKYVVVKESDNYDPTYVNPIISIYITAMGRLRIHEESKKIATKHLLYKDTDSLMFIDDGTYLKKFKINKELGNWKLLNEKEDAKILGEKRYYIGNDVKISGMTRRERNKEVIDNERDVKIKRMFGISSAFQTGEWDKVGGFKEMEIEMKPHNKLMLPLPDFIDECKLELEE